MLNRQTKREAISRLKSAIADYEGVHEQTVQTAGSLHALRQSTAEETIAACESYLTDLANAPKQFGVAVKELRVEYTDFASAAKKIKKKAQDTTVKGGGGAVGGALAGTGVAAMGPSALMGVATTFGTASTGTAISSLSGAAATNAAAAWLGGGAVAAGGGGMAAGNALMAAAGPVGIGIGAVALVGSGFYINQKNAEIAREATSKAVDVEADTRGLKASRAKAQHLCDLTKKHARGVSEQLGHLREESPSDYRAFSDADKQKLGALINNVQALTARLGETVGNEA